MENMNNQGKRPDQYSNSAKFAWYGVVGMITLLILMTLLSGCSTTKKCCSKDDVTTTKPDEKGFYIKWGSLTPITKDNGSKKSN